MWKDAGKGSIINNIHQEISSPPCIPLRNEALDLNGPVTTNADIFTSQSHNLHDQTARVEGGLRFRQRRVSNEAEVQN
jgi:hypothetical protein